jgi:hypothetical protein
MEKLSDSKISTCNFGDFIPLLTWSSSPDHFRTTALSPNCSINRYYDPTTESFISVDPDFQMTDQAYVFTNDDPLNETDPLGLKCKTKSCSTKITETGSNPSGNWNQITITNLNGDTNGTIEIVGGSDIRVVVQDEGDGFVIANRSPGNESVTASTDLTGATASRGLFEAGDVADFSIPSTDASTDIFQPRGSRQTISTGVYVIKIETSAAADEIVGNKVTIYFKGKIWSASPLR